MNIVHTDLHRDWSQRDPAPREIVLVDPSLFTAPYDAALSAGLAASGANPRWATRQLRRGEHDALAGAEAHRFFYPLTDGPRRGTLPFARVLKGVEHWLGMRKLIRLVESGAVDLVHLQWLLVPLIDRAVIARLRRHCPVVVTVHDTEPFNGKSVSAAQRAGLLAAYRAADRLIVHRPQGRDVLMGRGIDPERVDVVPHGLLSAPRATASRERRPGRWRILLIGKLQHYKGLDILIEAAARLPAEARDRLSITIAGEAMLPIAPLAERIAALGLPVDLLDLRPGQLPQAEFDALIDDADAFVFPYRAIEASGVLFSVLSSDRWIIASDIGAFADVVRNGADGALVPVEDADALATALAASIGRRPLGTPGTAIPGWREIGAMTRDVYSAAADSWRRETGRPR